MENKNEQSTVSSLLRFAGPYKGRYALSICLSVLGVASGLVPYYAAAQMLIGLIGSERDFSFYILWGIVAIVGYLAKSTFAILSTSVSHTATFLALRDIRKQIVDKLSRMPMGTLLNTPSGQLKDTLVDRVEGLETPLAHLLPEMSANVLVPIFIVIYLFVLDWRMALISLITIPVGMAFMATILKTYPQQYEGSVKINQRMNNAVVEYVNGIEVIKAFNQSAASYGKYSDAVRDNADYFYKWMKSCQWAMASYNAICPAVLITVLPAGVLFYATGSITAANLITIIILSLGIVGPLIAASNFADSLGMVGTVVNEIAALPNRRAMNTRPQNRCGSLWARTRRQDNETRALDARKASCAAPISMGRGEIPVEPQPAAIRFLPLSFYNHSVALSLWIVRKLFD